PVRISEVRISEGPIYSRLELQVPFYMLAVCHSQEQEKAGVVKTGDDPTWGLSPTFSTTQLYCIRK
ncbi:MAG: hypothetical protein AAF492_24760, partial [Verrucomicrobiota bacterium]